MATKLVEFNDEIFVEVETSSGQARQISWRSADKINGKAFEKIKRLLIQASKPISEAFTETSSDLDIESAEVEFGIGFEGEGNIYVAKTKATANVSIKMTVKPKKI